MDPTGWWISEKLDGVRAFWDGQRLYSRQKIEWNAPSWWKNRKSDRALFNSRSVSPLTNKMTVFRRSGLPKDITLDGELWMARGTFDQTSQICRTTVRLGRLRTFTHFLDRDSMERQWLREQVGGRLASQDRVRGERSALSLLPSSARRVDEVIATGPQPASSTTSTSAWKTWKRSGSQARSDHSSRKRCLRSESSEPSRFGVARTFLRTLFGRSSVLQGPAASMETQRPRPAATLRCARCGKIVKRRKARAPRPDEEERTNADQLLSEPPLPSAPASTSRQPHVYSTINTSISGLSARTIPSAYTHVCRRKSKSSNEWNRIKFMVGTQRR